MAGEGEWDTRVEVMDAHRAWVDATKHMRRALLVRAEFTGDARHQRALSEITRIEKEVKVAIDDALLQM